MRLSRAKPWASLGRPFLRTVSSTATKSATCARNQGSKLHAAWISSSDRPSRNAWAMISSRSGDGVASALRMASLSAALVASAMVTSLRPVRPVSMERSAFCRLSAKVRPIAMASPTDFIEVVSRGAVPGNFSKVKRGILVTI